MPQRLLHGCFTSLHTIDVNKWKFCQCPLTRFLRFEADRLEVPMRPRPMIGEGLAHALPSCIKWRWIHQRSDGWFHAHVRLNGRDHELGVFQSAVEANAAVVEALRVSSHG